MDILFAGSLAVFAVTLTITKSKLFACKREFVENRYKAAFVGEQRPSFIHTVWHAWWTCPMCLGFWVALACSPFFVKFGVVFDTLIMYGMNWLLHCLESYLVEDHDLK